MKTLRCLLLALLLLPPLPALATQVLILHAGAPHFAAELARGLQAADPAAQVAVQIEDLAGSAAYRPQLEALWRVKYAGVDALVAADAVSLDFLEQRRTAVFGPVPVIVLSYAPRPAARPGFLFIELTPDLRANLSLIKRLQPEVRQVRLVVGPLSAAQRAAFEAVCAQFTADLDWAIWPEEAALEARLAALGPDAAVVWAANGCGGGNDFTNFKRMTSRLKAPVYGLWDTYLGAGLVGGVMLPTRAAGRAVAAMLPAILSGSAVAAPRLEPELVVDGRALERYGLKRSGLPAGARVSARVNPGEHILTPWLLLAALAGWLITLLWAGLLLASRRRYRGDLARLGGELDFVRSEHAKQLGLSAELQALLQDCDQALVAVADLQGRILMCNAGFVEAGLASCPSLAELVDGELWPVLMSAVQAGGRWSGSLRLANGQSFSACLRRVLPGAPASLVLVARPAAE